MSQLEIFFTLYCFRFRLILDHRDGVESVTTRHSLQTNLTEGKLLRLEVAGVRQEEVMGAEAPEGGDCLITDQRSYRSADPSGRLRERSMSSLQRSLECIESVGRQRDDFDINSN